MHFLTGTAGSPSHLEADVENSATDFTCLGHNLNSVVSKRASRYSQRVMADNQYVIPPPPEPERTQRAQHPRERRRANIALGVACLAVFFAAWQAYEARQARLDAKNASLSQEKDVERARKAAEESAAAAMLLAEVGKQSLSISDRGALASERSAHAAEQSLRTSKELFAEGRRAEMSRITTVMQQFEVDKPMKYEVQVLNAGRSRAVKVTTVTSHLALSIGQEFPPEPPYNFPPDAIYRTRPRSVSVVLPGERLIQAAEVEVLPPSLIEGVTSGRERMYIHGKITYDDADGRHHTTTFCDYYVPGQPTMTACSVYNSAN
jgi:hypothetical protein